MPELIKKLSDMYMDECDGVTEYAELSEQMQKEHPDTAYAQIFRDMAKEEKTHRSHIKHVLMDMGAEFTEEMSKAEEDSDKAYKKIFC